MKNVFIMSDAVYEELYDCYLSFNAIGKMSEWLWGITVS